MPRALFFGSPAFAVPSLDALGVVAEVVGVVCQPDKPAGRGLTLTPPAVKVRATELGLPVVQPTKLRTGEFGAWVREQQVDVALVVAYGRILPKDVLEGPQLGCVNVHASLLPKYRGAASTAVGAGRLRMPLPSGWNARGMNACRPRVSSCSARRRIRWSTRCSKVSM